MEICLRTIRFHFQMAEEGGINYRSLRHGQTRSETALSARPTPWSRIQRVKSDGKKPNDTE